MKLFRIIVLHAAPKDSHTSTETYLVALNDEAVANWIEREKCHGNWFTPYDHEDEDERSMRSVEIEGEYKGVPFKEYILANNGDLEDEEGWEDAYYGVTKWGWQEVPDATAEDMDRLAQLQIAVKA